MSLIQSAKLNGHDPYAYLKDVLLRLPTQLHNRIDELLPYRWQHTADLLLALAAKCAALVKICSPHAYSDCGDRRN